MSDVKWIHLSVDIFDNRKIKQIRKMPEGSDICLMWFQLMCLAGTINDYGQVYITKEIPYTEEMLAAQFDLSIHTVRLGLSVFEKFGMIEIIDNIVRLSSWEKYQNVDGLERIREQNRLRKQKQRERERQKLLLENNRDDELPDCSAEVITEGNGEHEEKAEVPVVKRTVYSDEFNEFWKIYPRSDAKSEAYKNFMTRMKEGFSPNDLIDAAKNYADTCRRERREKKFILQAKTFLGPNLRFEDYLKKESEESKTEAADGNPFDVFFKEK